MSIRNFRAAFGVMLLACLAACGSESYRPAPIDADAAQKGFADRTLADPGLKEFALRRGHRVETWPPARWGWSELSIAGLYYHPDLAIARARQQVAAAALEVASLRPAVAGNLLLEHHGDTTGKSSAGSYGLEVEFPVAGGDRRGARLEQAEAELSAADFDTAATQWQVRIRILHRIIDLFAARDEVAALREETQTRLEIQRLLTTRLSVGAASASEVAATERAVLAIGQALDQGAIRETESFAGLADAVGVTTEKLRQIELSFEDLRTLHVPADSGLQLRASALHERADVRRLLADYAAAEAAVKLEIARQFPEFSLRPGYLWDQGDSRWSLAIAWLVPPAFGNQPAIRLAEAKRQLAAEQFMARQAAVVAEIDAALARNILAQKTLAGIQSGLESTADHEMRSLHSFAAGAIDRLDLLERRLERLAAERLLRTGQAAALHAYADLAAALQMPQLSIDMPAVAKLQRHVEPIKR